MKEGYPKIYACSVGCKWTDAWFNKKNKNKNISQIPDIITGGQSNIHTNVNFWFHPSISFQYSLLPLLWGWRKSARAYLSCHRAKVGISWFFLYCLVFSHVVQRLKPHPGKSWHRSTGIFKFWCYATIIQVMKSDFRIVGRLFSVFSSLPNSMPVVVVGRAGGLGAADMRAMIRRRTLAPCY